ncbi:MAG: CDP-alcohol phosphatidyltransferase family protein [Calditrichaeota bacterium]|nr:CDP-alcohol phosphatidyltransferase family protein [Calditrichota bacterium]
MEKLFVRKVQFLTNMLIKINVTPNVVTISSLILGIFAGILLALEHKLLGLVFLILMGLADILDGQLATTKKLTSSFGAVLDSTVDRYSEAFVFMGLGVYFFQQDQPGLILVIGFAMLGSISASYVKAKAESLNYDCPVGLMQRSERIVILAIGLLFPDMLLKFVLIIIAVMTNVTVVQRVIYVKKAIEKAGNREFESE